MPNRSQPPPIKTIEQLQLPSPTRHTLDNGISVYEINQGTQEVLKLEILFRAGRPYEQDKLASRATASLIKEGTPNYTSAAIAEKVDFYGGTLSTPFSMDTSRLVLYSLSRYFEKLLPLVAEMIKMPLFPEEELRTYTTNNKQQLQVDLAKNDVVAYREVTGRIFGEEHPYGYNSLPKHYDQLNRQALINHHQTNFTTNNCTIFISGKVEPSVITLLNQYLGSGIPSGAVIMPSLPTHIPAPEKLRISHPDNVQTAIRMGRKLFSRHHEDYAGMYVLNTILGGYFGSRLMANIREEKGYTYNIFSTVDTMYHDGCFYIGTEVGNGFKEKTIAEIYHEIKMLQTELVEKDELEMVRNYLMGNMLSMFDGPFNLMDLVKTTVMEQLPENAYEHMVSTIRNINPDEIQGLAKQYLNAEDLWEVIVG